MIEFLNRLFSHRFAPLVAFIVIAVAFAIVSQHQLNTIRHTQTAISVTQTQQGHIIKSACVRLNIELADENRSHYEDYDFFTLVYKENQDAAPANAAILKKLGVKLPANLNKDQALALDRLKHDINGKTWTPLLDCNSVTSARFHVPQPIAFTHRLPPKSALQVPPQPASNPGHHGVVPIQPQPDRRVP